MPVNTHTLVLTNLVVAIGAALQGSVGFGLGLFAAPLLLLLAPALVPGPLLAASLVLTALLTHHERAGINWADLGWALGGRAAGIVVAAVLLVVLSAEAVGLWSGVLVLLAVALSASGLHIRPTPRTLLTAGLLAGVLGTAVATGGPPIALLYQRQPGPQLRGTLAAFFLVGVALSLIGLGLAGRFGLPEIQLAGYVIPGILIGFLASRHGARVLDRGFTRPAILIISALSSIVVIGRALR